MTDVPIWDWQFIVVSTIAAGALWVLVRQVVPRRSPGGDLAGGPACANCPSHPESTAAKARRTTTTPVVSLSDLRDTARAGPRRS